MAEKHAGGRDRRVPDARAACRAARLEQRVGFGANRSVSARAARGANGFNGDDGSHSEGLLSGGSSRDRDRTTMTGSRAASSAAETAPEARGVKRRRNLCPLTLARL